MKCFAALILLAGCATPTRSVAPQVTLLADGAAVAAKTSRSVVLIVNWQDTKSVYGAGFLVGRGKIVTNKHVVDGANELGVLLHDPARRGYIPQDGGLDRFVFEYRRAFVPARVRRVDALVDLALIEIDADTTPWGTLEFASGAAVGEHIFALGHPKGAVWSFAAGVVSAVHEGIVQHDAPTNVGNSGGPIVNAQGKVVAVNTMTTPDYASGIGFARPVSAVARVLDSKVDASPLDRSTPQNAVANCYRALESLSPNFVDCLDWSNQCDQIVQMVLQALQLDDSAESLAAAKSMTFAPGGPCEVVRNTFGLLHVLPAGEAKNRKLSLMIHGTLPSGEPVDRELPPGMISIDDAVFTRLKRGVRVDDVARVGDDFAWVRLATRGPTGEERPTSELWRKGEGGWRRMGIEPGQYPLLPQGWPPAEWLPTDAPDEH